METKELSPTNCQDLEDEWRLKLELAQDAYHKAVTRYGQLMKKSKLLSPACPRSAVQVAHDAAGQALGEYARVLRIFTALTVDKKLPEETIVREAASA